jgi:glyoxylase-like metal-dependent hydrolase (beta-lactamase superfamily II)
MTACLALGCGPEPLRIPRIPPELSNWDASLRGPRGLRLHVFTTGSLHPPGALLGGSWLERVTLEVPVYLLEHPRAGLVLIGTGLSGELVESPEKHLGWFLAAGLEPKAARGQDIAAQLHGAGFAPERVHRVILPDLRFPQTGSVGRFRNAEVVVAEAERAWALGATSRDGVRPADLASIRRWETVDFAKARALGTFHRAQDLLGDGSVVLLDAPGYTPGTMALLVRLRGGPVLIAGAVCPRENTLRSPTVPLVATDRFRWWESIWRLKRFRELVPGLLVAPGFETASLGAVKRRDIRRHEVRAAKDAGAPAAPRPAPRRPAVPLPEPPAGPPLPLPPGR